MADVTLLSAEQRVQVGKGAARAARRAGLLPGVIYGAKKPPIAVVIEPKALLAEWAKPGFFGHLFDIEVDGAKHRVLCREVQQAPISDRPIHVDFLRVGAATRIDVEVPVTFINEEDSPGLRRGGLVNVVRRTIELNSRADSIPSEIVIDLAGREIGDSIHISHISLPEGVKPTVSDRDFTVATIVAPSAVAAEAAEAQEAAEAAAEEEEEAVEVPEEAAVEAPEGEAKEGEGES
ncbi:MAG: 50S ribosomal protein L25/general stress protein Ctc [Alphaproteobacteria bacterium]